MGVPGPTAHTYDRLVLVTGGAGFLGSGVVHHVSAAGHPVAVVDDGSGGTRTRMEELGGDPAVTVHPVDLRKPAELAGICRAERPWAVVHLAGRHFIPYCEEHPQETWQVNVEGTRNLLDALAAAPPSWFVLASTADVYRESARPHGEEDPVGASTVYGRSKTAAERLVGRAASCWGTRAAVARLFNLYGPGDTVEHLIPTVVRQAVASELLYLGDITTVRDFVHVDDAAAALAALMGREAHGIYNIGTGIPASGENVVELVGTLLGKNLAVKQDRRRLRSHNRRALVADARRLARLLPWWPATPLGKGVSDMVNAAAAHAGQACRPRLVTPGEGDGGKPWEATSHA
jgi:UDP-glucose 4-epimerase